jgi:hypothetical protein
MHILSADHLYRGHFTLLHIIFKHFTPQVDVRPVGYSSPRKSFSMTFVLKDISTTDMTSKEISIHGALPWEIFAQ